MLRSGAVAEQTPVIEHGEQWPTLDALQADYVQRVLVHTQGNKQKAARILGVTRRTLYRWLTNDD